MGWIIISNEFGTDWFVKQCKSTVVYTTNANANVKCHLRIVILTAVILKTYFTKNISFIKQNYIVDMKLTHLS